MENAFLPAGYEQPETGGNYLKLVNGVNKFRILSNSITGWEYWNTLNKPVRSKEEPTSTPNIKTDKDGRTKISHFWAFVVWDYKSQGIKILELTQRTIQDAIIALYKDENWGDPKGYDLAITKTGEKMDTKYTLVPAPPKPVLESIKSQYERTIVNLEALYSGADPFAIKAEQLGTVIEDRRAVEQAEIDQALQKPQLENIPF